MTLPACNLCGYSPKTEPEEPVARLCPQCRSNERQRTFKILLETVLEPKIFRGAALRDGLLLSPGRPEIALLTAKFENATISSLYPSLSTPDFVRADVRDLKPFADRSFDYVQACNVLDYIPDFHLALASVRRVLRPGGTFTLLWPRHLLPEGHAAPSISVRANVTGEYWPDKNAVPAIRLGHDTLRDFISEAGFDSTDVRVKDCLTPQECVWWVCR